MSRPKNIRIKVSCDTYLKFTPCSCENESVYGDFQTAKDELINRMESNLADAINNLEKVKALTYEDTYAETQIKRNGDDFIPSAATFNCGCHLSLPDSKWLFEWHKKYINYYLDDDKTPNPHKRRRIGDD